MAAFPDVLESVARGCLTAGEQKRLHLCPYFAAVAHQLAQQQSGVFEINGIAPSAKLHREDLLWREGTNRKRLVVEHSIAEGKPTVAPNGARARFGFQSELPLCK